MPSTSCDLRRVRRIFDDVVGAGFRDITSLRMCHPTQCTPRAPDVAVNDRMSVITIEASRARRLRRFRLERHRAPVAHFDGRRSIGPGSKQGSPWAHWTSVQSKRPKVLTIMIMADPIMITADPRQAEAVLRPRVSTGEAG